MSTVADLWIAELGEVERRRLFFPAFEQAMQRISRVHQMARAGNTPRPDGARPIRCG